MKKFLYKVLFFGIFCLLICIVPSVIVDPYNVFHWKNIRNNGVEPNKNYIKTKYILENPGLFDGYILGSSRVGVIHGEKIVDKRIYNMTYSMGTPKENLETLQAFLEHGVKVDVIYLGVDSLSYTEKTETHNKQGLRASYQYLSDFNNKASLYFDPTLVIQSIPVIKEKKDIEGIDVFYEYGWWCDYGIDTKYNWNTAEPSMGETFLLNETLDVIGQMKELCDQNGIELVVFTSPMCEITYEESVEEYEYLTFLESLADITNYYNFSGMNEITRDNDNFIDNSHYRAEIGDLMIDAMVYDKTEERLLEQGFGFYVTKENVQVLLDILQKTK